MVVTLDKIAPFKINCAKMHCAWLSQWCGVQHSNLRSLGYQALSRNRNLQKMFFEFMEEKRIGIMRFWTILTSFNLFSWTQRDSLDFISATNNTISNRFWSSKQFFDIKNKTCTWQNLLGMIMIRFVILKKKFHEFCCK